jgi:hypothetical protein
MSSDPEGRSSRPQTADCWQRKVNVRSNTTLVPHWGWRVNRDSRIFFIPGDTQVGNTVGWRHVRLFRRSTIDFAIPCASPPLSAIAWAEDRRAASMRDGDSLARSDCTNRGSRASTKRSAVRSSSVNSLSAHSGQPGTTLSVMFATLRPPNMVRTKPIGTYPGSEPTELHRTLNQRRSRLRVQGLEPWTHGLKGRCSAD